MKNIIKLTAIAVVLAGTNSTSAYAFSPLVEEHNGIYGVINSKGEEVIPVKYKDICGFENGIAEVNDGKRIFYVDKYGTEVARDGKIMDRLPETEYFPTGKNVVSYTCEEGIKLNEEGTLLSKREYGKLGVVDSEGNEVVPCRYLAIGNKYVDGILKVQNDDGCYGFVNSKGEEAVPCKYKEHQIAGYDYSEQINEGLISVMKDDKWGYIDYDGKTVIPLQYTYADMFNDGRAVVRGDNYKYGLIDKDGVVVTPCVYDDIERFNDGVAKAKKNDKYGALDKEGKETVPCVYDKINNFENGIAFAEKDGMWGVINENGETVVPFSFNYDRVENTKNGYALVGYEKEEKLEALSLEKEKNCWKKDSRWYYLDSEGNKVYGWKNIKGKWYYFEDNGYMHTGWLNTTDGNWYYLDSTGEMLCDTAIDGYELGTDGAWIK